MSAASLEREKDVSSSTTFQKELLKIESALRDEFSLSVATTFINSVEEEEFDRDEIVQDIKDGLSGNEDDSNLLSELDFTDPERRQLFCQLVLTILDVTVEDKSNEGGEGEGDATTPSSD